MGFAASGSGIIAGASSSQSSGLDCAGSGICASSTQSAGFSSASSSISSGGLNDGSKSSKSEPDFLTSSSTSTSYVLSFFTDSVYTCGTESTVRLGGSIRCFSSIEPSSGLACRMMTWILFVFPHLSGPNITTYGVSPSSFSGEKSSDAVVNLRYAPPHSRPSSRVASYCSVRPSEGSKGAANAAAAP